jgi:ribosome-associated heat shock protein Hsp15
MTGGKMICVETARVDQWLWAIRLYKTRSAATEACRGGHVRINGSPVKPAAKVRPGDRVTAHVHGRDHLFEVVTAIQKRVGAPQAAECAIDRTPPAATREPPVFVRERGSGRPTKQDRRKLDQLRQ